MKTEKEIREQIELYIKNVEDTSIPMVIREHMTLMLCALKWVLEDD